MQLPLLFVGLSATMLLSGCAYQFESSSHDKPATVEAQQTPALTEVENKTPSQNITLERVDRSYHVPQPSSYKPLNEGEGINQYVQTMVEELMSNVDPMINTAPVAVSSFVYLDSDLQQGDVLGNQIAESVMHELFQHKVQVLDFKALDYIRVTPQGDFTYSRDFTELSQDLPMGYFLSGTLTPSSQGVLVNARLVAISSKQVLGTSQGLIPQAVVDSLMARPNTKPLLVSQ